MSARFQPAIRMLHLRSKQPGLNHSATDHKGTTGYRIRLVRNLIYSSGYSFGWLRMVARLSLYDSL
jgi:hypothetical protein